MRSAVPLLRTPAAPWTMMRSPRRTAATMPKRSAPLPSIVCRMASTLTGALSSWDGPAGLNRSDFDASIVFYRGRIGLGTGAASIPAGPFFEGLSLLTVEEEKAVRKARAKLLRGDFVVAPDPQEFAFDVRLAGMTAAPVIIELDDVGQMLARPAAKRFSAFAATEEGIGKTHL